MLAIVLLTYNRLSYAKQTLNSVLKNLVLPNGEEIHVHIADDGSSTPADYSKQLIDLCVANPRVAHWTQSNSLHKGYGANYNLAMQTVHPLFRADQTGLVLPLEDDWELYRPLDLTTIIGALREQQFGCVRMGYVGYTQPLRCRFVKYADQHWLELDPDSEEPHVFAGHPRLETVAWERSVGPWPEGLNPGETEFAVAHWPAARQGVAWPLSLINVAGDAFAHVGTIRSY